MTEVLCRDGDTEARDCPEIVVVGQIARDLVLVVDEVPDAGATVDVRRRRELLGGKGANIAVGLAQLGASVAVVGVVGDDQVGAGVCSTRRCGTGSTPRPSSAGAGCESALMVDIVTPDGQWRYLESVPEGALLTAEDVERGHAIVLQAATDR